MSLQNILVHLDHTAQSDSRFEVALALAASHRCLLSGMFPIAPPYFTKTSRAAELDQLKQDLELQATARDIRLQWIENDDWRTTLSVADQLILQAYYADLVVIGKPDATAGPRSLADLPERLVIGSGTPVLVVPPQGTFHPVPRRVVIGWRAGRASVRSLRDALPLLQQAQQVKVICLATSSEQTKGEECGFDQLCSHLARHEVAAETECLVSAGIGLGDALLNRAVDEAADLLVVGGFAYKQPMPVAAHLVKHATIPIFMSH